MLNIISSKNKKYNQAHKKLTIDDIEKFYSVSKNKKSLIGLEYERLSLDKNTLENASYDKLEKIIKTFSEIKNWELIFDLDVVIGAKSKNSTSISLEPGCQLEISLAPKEDILSIHNELIEIINLLDEIAKLNDVIFLGYGISPKSSVDSINILQKRRYKIMNNYLPNCSYGELAPKMMRQSAGIQINIDYFSPKDAYLKMKFFNLIMPFMSALFANSPLENNILSDKKSLRSYVWRYTGKNRCNFFYGDIFDFSFFNNQKDFIKKYINKIIDVPMIFIERDGKNIEINGKINFREFMKHGYLDYSATIDDYILHQSLCFPDVRMKKYIEIRNHDSADYKMALALCAFYKGLAKANFSELLQKFNFLKLNKIDEYNLQLIQNGLDYNINPQICAWDVIIKLFNISKNNLNSSERAYLEPLFNLIKKRKTLSDLIIENSVDSAFSLVEFLNKKNYQN